MNPSNPTGYKNGIRSYGGPADRTPQPEWHVTDDGKGLLTGTLRRYVNGAVAGGDSNWTGVGGNGSIAGGGGGSWPTTLHTGGNTLGYANGDSSSGIVPKKGEAHPFDRRLVCTDFTVNYQGNEIAYIDANYVGIEGEVAGIEWELTCPTEETPIEMHPDFLSIGTSSIATGQQSGFDTVTQSGINPKTNAPYWNRQVVKVDDETQRFEGFVYSTETTMNKLAGVTSYKLPRPTLRITYSTKTPTTISANILATGKITDKPEFAPAWLSTAGSSGTVQNPNANYRNWLLSSTNVTEMAGIYKVQNEYILSGEGGWNPIIYKSQSQR